MSSSTVHAELIKKEMDMSLVTVKRALSEMAKSGLLAVQGSGPSTAYSVSAFGRLNANIDARTYCAVEPDKRYGLSRYNFELLPAIPVDIFSDEELRTLEDATAEYRRRTFDIPDAIQKKELERLVVELSWKSSRIEGNTYTLLDTEKLILENKEAPGHSKSEALMILNHKNAFAFIRENASQFKNLTRANLEKLHAVLVKDLSVDEKEYREAMLVFYELNSIILFKKIFISQYDFAAKNYAVK